VEHREFGDSDMIRSGLFHALTGIAGLARAPDRGLLTFAARAKPGR